jgi:multimeric flavodoxin WrbA
MKVLAVNSSPRAGNGSVTELMLTHLVKGMQDAGAEVEVVNLREKTIKNCIGCFTCWTKTPGKCIHQDDMTKELLPKFKGSDLVVFATPLYFHTMNAAMSAFRERTLPNALPFFELDEQGKTYHPLRAKAPAVVWLSVCGFPDESEFGALSDYLNRTRHKDIKLVAEIYRSASGNLASPGFQKQKEDILNATEQAGREIVQSLKVSPETMARIKQPFGESITFAQIGNIFWKTCIAEKVTLKEFNEKEMVPRPDSLEEFMLLMSLGLDSEATGDKKAVLQFKFSGTVKDSCHFIIEKGKIEAKPGIYEKPDLTIETPFALWMDIMTRKADGQKLFMQQKYKVNGDLSLMMRLFRREQ